MADRSKSFLNSLGEKLNPYSASSNTPSDNLADIITDGITGGIAGDDPNRGNLYGGGTPANRGAQNVFDNWLGQRKRRG